MKYISWDYNKSVSANIVSIITEIIAALTVTFGIACLNSYLIMLLWNAIAPITIFGCVTITFWQAFGLILILWLFTGGIGKIIIRIYNRIMDS